MFADMRSALGITKKIDILEHIDGLPVSQQPAAIEAIRSVERKAMESQIPQPGLAALMSYLDSRQIPKAICTRNFDVPVQNLLDKFLVGSTFHPVVTRDFRPPKPDPAGILHIATAWGLRDKIVDSVGNSGGGELGGNGSPDASGLIMVGDSIDDITAGRRAGAATVLLLNDVNRALATHECTDLAIERLDELVAILEAGFEGRDIGTNAEDERLSACERKILEYEPTSSVLR